MATNSVYKDERYLDQKTKIDADKKAEINEVDKTYGNMIAGGKEFYDKQIDAVEKYGETQKKNQQAQTDFAIQKIEQQKAQAKQDYTKEQSGAYVDWQKQSGEYGVNAEKQAAAGLAGTGYSESALTAQYVAYQNRVTAAKETYARAVLNYDNSIAEARMQNSVLLAEIAYNTLQKSLELGLAGFQHENTLLLEKAKEKRDINKTYHTYYQDVLNQINQENALAEEKRQADMANKRQQEQIKIAQAELQLQRDKFNYDKEMDAKAADANAYSSSKSSGGSSKSSYSRQSYVKKQTNDEKKIQKADKKTTSATAYLNALIASGASKDKVSNEIAIALREGAITKAEAQKLRNTFTPRGVQY